MEEADVDLFAGRVASMRERVSRLFRSAQAGATQDMLASAFDELQSALEELHYAESALRAKAQQQLTSFESLDTERRYYCDLFEQAPVGYIITSSEGTIRQANGPAAALLATQARQLIGRSLALFVPEGSRRAFRSRIPQLGKAEGPHEWYTQLQPWKGQPIEVLLLVASSCDSAGRVAGLRWLVHQLGEQPQAQHAAAVGGHGQGVQEAQLAEALEELRAQLHALARYADELPLKERAIGAS